MYQRNAKFDRRMRQASVTVSQQHLNTDINTYTPKFILTQYTRRSRIKFFVPYISNLLVADPGKYHQYIRFIFILVRVQLTPVLNLECVYVINSYLKWAIGSSSCQWTMQAVNLLNHFRWVFVELVILGHPLGPPSDLEKHCDASWKAFPPWNQKKLTACITMPWSAFF